jgi:RNA polymerase sigma-70 factor, ECF subfamily
MNLLPLWLALQVGDDDAGLAERLQQRDPKAMAELYDRYGRLVYSLIFRIVRDSAVAEDLAQESFLRVWNRIQGFDARRGALGAWILAVARNRAIDYVRSVDGRMARSAFEAVDLENPALFADLEREVLSSDQVRKIRAAVEKLSPHHRQVIEMAYFEGLSQTEMAERLKQPLGTVKTWVRVALKTLRDELAGAA